MQKIKKNDRGTIMSEFKDKLNKKKYYEIRLESIGGLGANLCGKMLGELGVKYLGVNSISFSSYGSEKTGTPVKGHIRYSNNETEIRSHSPVENPDILVVFHQALLKEERTYKGCTEDTSVIIATENGQVPEINFRGIIYGLDAQRIAIETRSRINTVMLGATLKIMGLDDVSSGEKICEETLGKKYPEALKANLLGMRRGFEEVAKLNVEFKENEDQQKNNNTPKWGYDNAPIGGINPLVGNSVISDLSPSRQGYFPIFIKDRCINCGLCHSTCPDMVFQFDKGENKGLDYYHCKGCLRCVDICPVNALVRGVEAEHPQKEFFMSNRELLRTPDYYEKSGADGYITSESFLTEERIEGGLV